jgi:Uncharacterized protein conserved in bacteria (DUF2135)
VVVRIFTSRIEALASFKANQEGRAMISRVDRQFLAAGFVALGTLLALSLGGSGQGPSATNTGNSSPIAALRGTWSGKEELQGYGALTFEFEPGGVCFTADKLSRQQGTWKRVDDNVTLTFYNGYVVYRGSVFGRTISGTASNEKNSWRWSVNRVSRVTLPPEPKYVPGEPRLVLSRWALAHGRWDGARAVGILTDDNPKGQSLPKVRTLIETIAGQPDPILVNLDLDATGKQPANQRKPSPVLAAAADLPGGMSLLVFDPGVKQAGWKLKNWDPALPRFANGNYYATVPFPDKKISTGMELVTEEHFAAYKANSILWEAPHFGDLVVPTDFTGGTISLNATVVSAKQARQLIRPVAWADTLELTLREVGDRKPKDGRIPIAVEATLPAGFESVRMLRWAAETTKTTLFGEVTLSAEKVNTFVIQLPDNTLGEVRISAVATPGPFVHPLESIRKDGSVGTSTFRSLGSTLEDRMTASIVLESKVVDDRIADELKKAKAKSGDVQISLYWTSKNDLDLHVICPSKEEIYFAHRHSKCGGALDVDQNADPITAKNQAVENVFWPTGKAPRGKYQVYVNFYGNHGNTGQPDYPDPATFTVRVVAQGRMRTFTGSVSLNGDRRKVLVHEFDLP